MRKLLGWAGRGLQVVVAAGLIAWVALALHFQISAPWVYLWYAALGLLTLLMIYRIATLNWRRVSASMIVLALVSGGWWWTIKPRQDRDWMPEVSRGVTAEVGADTVTLRNIRNFEWASPTEATPGWYDLTVDPDAITSVDMALSVWDSPDIAHTLVSFGFADGQHVVFSGEIRKETGEQFSTIGGFFKRYELVLIAADERDIIHLRTDKRGEQVSLYPVTLDAEKRRALFMAFVDYANELAASPRWYHTLTTNCTTMPYALVRKISDRVSLDLRIILSGRLPGYLHELGVLPQGLSLEETIDRARLAPLGDRDTDSATFSRRLRAAWTP